MGLEFFKHTSPQFINPHDLLVTLDTVFLTEHCLCFMFVYNCVNNTLSQEYQEIILTLDEDLQF